jgi:hypothetical protein
LWATTKDVVVATESHFPAKAAYLQRCALLTAQCVEEITPWSSFLVFAIFITYRNYSSDEPELAPDARVTANRARIHFAASPYPGFGN